ncbi:MAG: Asp23/Gls24 family envelope stress response protein [Lachnospiraceae bacterium]|nr:Asp23/Gls24 family envelope stress response protein [Lachnospiraceae bacterium]
MEKDTERKSYTLGGDEEMGAVKLADDVVAMIASIAATEVDGVSAMGGAITNEIMNKVGVKSYTKGVKVDIIAGVVKVDLSVMMEYGYNIPATSRKVQARVKTQIENMTGLKVSDVNIRIAAVDIKKDEQ